MNKCMITALVVGAGLTGTGFVGAQVEDGKPVDESRSLLADEEVPKGGIDQKADVGKNKADETVEREVAEPGKDMQRAEAATSANAKRAEKAEQEARTILARISAMDIVSVGFSVGPRVFLDPAVDEGVSKASIDPGTRGVVFNKSDHWDMVASFLVVAFPFQEEHKPDKAWDYWSLEHLGGVVNINFAAYGADAGVSVFNRSLEGGIGLAYRLDRWFALGLTFERAVYRVPHATVVEGEPVLASPTAEGQAPEYLNSIDVNDARYFEERDTSALSLKLVFLL